MTGRSSSAVGTTHDASKVTPCIVISLLAAKPPSPEVVHDKAPVPPGRVFLYDHIDPSWPRMFRIASCCQLPASRPAPGLHPRKGGRQIEKTHNTEGLGSENISMFFSNSIANRKGFLPRPAPFRGWTGAGESGRYNAPGLPEVSGSFGVRGTMIIDNSIIEANGAFRITETSYDVDYASFQVSSNLSSQGCTFDASRNNTIYGASPTVMPASVDIPICLYLGLHT